MTNNIGIYFYHQAVISMLHSRLFHILLSLILMDVVTGYAKAYKNKIVDSKIGTNGIIRHTIVILLQVFVGIFSRMYSIDYVSIALCIFNIGNYGTSILENLNMLGIPMPKGLEKYFKQMTEIDIKDTEDFEDD